MKYSLVREVKKYTVVGIIVNPDRYDAVFLFIPGHASMEASYPEEVIAMAKRHKTPEGAALIDVFAHFMLRSYRMDEIKTADAPSAEELAVTILRAQRPDITAREWIAHDLEVNRIKKFWADEAAASV